MLLSSRSILSTGFLILLPLVALTTCSDSNPLSPGDQATALKYFPLETGARTEYRLSIRHNEGLSNYYSAHRSIVGSCVCEVGQKLKKDSETHARINVSFIIDTDSYSYIMYEDTSRNRSSVDSNLTHTVEYFLLARGDSVWYVSGAPDFFHLDQGERELMMHTPGSGKSFLDLSLFEYLDWNLGIRNYSSEIKGDTLVFAGIYTGPGINDYIVKMTESDGFCSIECFKSADRTGTKSFENTTMTYTLVE